MTFQQRLVLWHRYLGIGCCLFFAMWFASGVVLMYAQMPVLTEGERLSALPPLALERIRVNPLQAVMRAGLPAPPIAVTLSSLFDRPVYRLQAASDRLVTVFADDGRVATSFSSQEAALSMAPYLNSSRPAHVLVDAPIGPDQWTVSGELDALRPLYRVSLNDGAGTVLYLSGVRGDVVLKTTTRSRSLAWAGAIPHWLYITALRRHAELWRRFVMSVAGAGCALCLLGLTLGTLRLSPSRRYRLRGRRPSRSPFDGVMRWHHMSGLLFGSIALMWVFSGLLTLDPGHFTHGTAPTRDEMRAFAGGDLNVGEFRIPVAALRQGAGHVLQIKEIALAQVDGTPFYRVTERPDKEVWLDSNGARAPYADHRMLMELGGRAVHGGSVSEAELISDFDAYYYDRDRRAPLPVLRLKFNDPHATWLYIDAMTGTPMASVDRAARVNRWLSDGLHRLDFPFLWARRPQWDVVVIGLSAGGLALSMTGIVIGFRRLSALATSTGATETPGGRGEVR